MCGGGIDDPEKSAEQIQYEENIHAKIRDYKTGGPNEFSTLNRDELLTLGGMIAETSTKLISDGELNKGYIDARQKQINKIDMRYARASQKDIFSKKFSATVKKHFEAIKQRIKTMKQNRAEKGQDDMFCGR